MLQQPSSSILNTKEANSTNIILINQQSTNQVTNENDFQFPISKNQVYETRPVASSAHETNSLKQFLNESKFVYKTPNNPVRNYDEALVKKYSFFF